MKKLLGFLLSVAILLGACFGVYYYLSSTDYMSTLAQSVRTLFEQALQAAQPDAQDPAPEGPTGPGAGTPSPSTPSGPAYNGQEQVVDRDEALDTLLYEAALNFTEEVDIAHLGYTTDELEEEVSRFFFFHPDLFYVDGKYSVYTAGEGGAVTKIKLNYLTTPAQAQTQLNYYNNVLDTVVGAIPAGASDFDKVLYLHDYLVKNYAYDYEGLAEETATGQSVAVRDAYTFFYGKVGVCQAYMLAMIALCEEAGIPCVPVVSEGMEHAWNLVKLDGAWYHVDVTWDDAGGEQSAVYPSYVSYRYFLLSGPALYNGGRQVTWQTSEAASSTKYDTALWREATTQMCKNGTDYFCVVYDKTANAPKIWRGTPEEMTAVATLDARWYSTYPSYYTQAWASIVVWEDLMLVNTADGFLYYNAATNTLSEAVDLSSTLGTAKIFGVREVEADGTVIFVVAEDYRGEFWLREWKLPTI